MDIAELTEKASITSRALKFKLIRGVATRRIRDKDAEKLVKSALGDEGQIVSREMFGDKTSEVAKYQRLATEMYSYHIQQTLPFGDDSSRVLMSAKIFDYTSAMQNFISRLEQLKQTIINDWDVVVAKDIKFRNDQMVAQGKAPKAKVQDYPTKAAMEQKLYVTWYPEAISVANDFRFEMPQYLLDEVDKQLQNAVDIAAQEVFLRMQSCVHACIGKLMDYSGLKGQKWYTTFVDNLIKLNEEIPALNIKQDPKVTQILGAIWTAVEPYAFTQDPLKDIQANRDDLRHELELISNTLQGVIDG